MSKAVTWTPPTDFATILTTALDGLTNGANSAQSGAIANGTSKARYMALELYLASLTPVGAAAILVYLQASLDGSNYPEAGPTSDQLLRSFYVSTPAATKRKILWNIPIPPLNFKLVINNAAGVALAASGNTLAYRLYGEQLG